MRLRTHLRNLLTRSLRGTALRPGPSRRWSGTIGRPIRPAPERLEDRTLLSVSAFLSGGTLYVGGDGSGSVATVRLAPADPTSAQVLDHSTVVGTFPNSSFGRAVVSLGGGLNTVNVQSFPNPFGGRWSG